jgi:hypothetical protein
MVVRVLFLILVRVLPVLMLPEDTRGHTFTFATVVVCVVVVCVVVVPVVVVFVAMLVVFVVFVVFVVSVVVAFVVVVLIGMLGMPIAVMRRPGGSRTRIAFAEPPS